jgi:hypothetical protein
MKGASVQGKYIVENIFPEHTEEEKEALGEALYKVVMDDERMKLKRHLAELRAGERRTEDV